MIVAVNRAGWLVVFSLLLTHELRAQERDAGNPAPSRERGTAAASRDANRAAAQARARALIERQAEARCVTELNGLRYYQARTSPRDQQQAAAFREVADRCMSRARAMLNGPPEVQPHLLEDLQQRQQQRQQEQADLQTDYESMQSSPEAIARKKQEEAAIERRGALRVKRDEEDLEIAKNPQTIRMILSIDLCSDEAERANTVKEIAKDRRYSRAAGVVNLSDREELKTTLRDADEAIAADRSRLKRMALAPIACSQPDLKQVWGCINEPILGVLDERYDKGDVCTGKVVQAYLRSRSMVEGSIPSDD